MPWTHQNKNINPTLHEGDFMGKKVRIDDIADVVNNHWPSENFYMEDSGDVWEEPSHGGLFKIDEDGVVIPTNPGEMVNLSDFDFYFAWRGKGEEDRKGVPNSFVALFNRVQKAKTHVTMTFHVPKGKEAEVETFVKKLGGSKR